VVSVDEGIEDVMSCVASRSDGKLRNHAFQLLHQMLQALWRQSVPGQSFFDLNDILLRERIGWVDVKRQYFRLALVQPFQIVRV
jgi:hypothetical protein